MDARKQIQQTETQFHALCSSCRKAVKQFRLLTVPIYSLRNILNTFENDCGLEDYTSSNSWGDCILGRTEKVKLHATLDDFQKSLSGGCHLCHLLSRSIDTSAKPESNTRPEVFLLFHLNRAKPGKFSRGRFLAYRSDLPPTEEEILGVRRTPLFSFRERGFPSPYEHERQWLYTSVCEGKGWERPRSEAPGIPSLAHSRRYTGSTDHLALAQRWLSECLGKHRTCGTRGLAFLPTRLIDTEAGESRIYLRELNSVQHVPVPTYCCLSHVWGKGSPLRLLRHNLSEFLNLGIHISRLARTFRQAVDICRALRIRYLWIDLLCIIQDDRGDKARELNTMCRIYKNAVVTICAAASTNSETGCFVQRNPLTYTPCRISSPEEEHLLISPHNDLETFEDLLDLCPQEPFFRRGWILQERLLSPRLLVFSREMMWRCNAGSATEAEPDGDGSSKTLSASNRIFGHAVKHVDWIERAVNPIIPSVRSAFTELIHSRALYQGKQMLNHIFASFWSSILVEFCNCDLTFPTDKLDAISGLVQRIQSECKSLYTAGIWHDSIFLDLLWQAREPGPLRRISTYIAPSWSWASRNLKVDQLNLNFLSREFHQMCHVIEIHATQENEEDTSGTGKVVDGYLRMLGHLRHALFQNKHPNEILRRGRNTRDSKRSILLGSKLIGRVWPDVAIEDGCEVSLVPVLREHSPKPRIYGLVLMKNDIGVDFERVGVFSVGPEWESDFNPRLDLDTWFTTAGKEEILIR